MLLTLIGLHDDKTHSKNQYGHSKQYPAGTACGSAAHAIQIEISGHLHIVTGGPAAIPRYLRTV